MDDDIVLFRSDEQYGFRSNYKTQFLVFVMKPDQGGAVRLPGFILSSRRVRETYE